MTTEAAETARELRHERLCGAMASAAHDLKTPVGVIAGYTDLLLSEKIGLISAKQRAVLREMQQQGRRLQLLVEDFLTLGTLEAGGLQCRFATDDLTECVQEICGIWEPRFHERGLALYHVRNGRIPPFAFDASKVQRLLSNLLENAWKYVPAGGSATVQAEPYRWERRTQAECAAHPRERRSKPFDAANAVRVRVSDTGPGIAAEYHLEVFDEFFRLPEAGESGGTGLGLSIARRLAHTMGGKIWVESEPGAGATFAFLLPLQPPTP